jgi:hypothetical protein
MLHATRQAPKAEPEYAVVDTNCLMAAAELEALQVGTAWPGPRQQNDCVRRAWRGRCSWSHVEV